MGVEGRAGVWYARGMNALRLAMILAVAVSAPVSAKTAFYAYEGPNAVRSGEGGTKTTVKGVDFWTAGTPYRRYQIIGTIVDDRMTGDGDAVGSKRVASAVLKAGGNAVLLSEQSVQDGGIATGGGPSGGYVVPIGFTVTRMVVVRYLD